MGQGYLLKCNKCDYREEVFLGVGYMFPEEYAELVRDIRKGCYGRDWQAFFEEHRGAVVNAETELYVCPQCGHLETEHNLSIYLNKQEKEPENGYWMRWADEDDYEFVRSYVHSCPDCGKRMEVVQDIEKADLRCPDCGDRLEVSGQIMWD